MQSLRRFKSCSASFSKNKRNGACEFCHKIDGRCKSRVKSFDEIPGPKGLPLIGTSYKYVTGEYDVNKLHKVNLQKYREFGPLVREKVAPGEYRVWIFKPEDIAEVFKAEGKLHPKRISHLALQKYRTDRPEIYNSGGLLPTNGEEWWRIRKEFQKDLSKPHNVTHYIPDTDDAVRECLPVCERNDRQDFLDHLSRLFFQLICLVAFDMKINPFSDEEMRSDSMSTKMIDAAYTTNSVILPLDNGPKLWKIYETSDYRKLRESQEYIEKIAVQMVDEKIEKLKSKESDDRHQSLLEIYLRNPAVNRKDVIGMTCDMLLAGVDTTTFSSAFALYHLSNSAEAQEKLHVEAKTLLPNGNDAITADTLKKAVFTKAVIKETFRLNPISIGVGRILQTDVVLSGYKVPKGTYVVTQNLISCRLPEYFKDPDNFMPERWLRESDKSEKVHPYLVLPFGHGPRSCIARRLAEQNMQILILRMCRHLQFEWEGGDLDFVTVPICKPDSPVKLKFQKRL